MSKNHKIFYLVTETLAEAEEAIKQHTLDVYPSKHALISELAAVIPVNLSTGPVTKISGESIIAPEVPENHTGTIRITCVKPEYAEILDYNGAEFEPIRKEILALVEASHPKMNFK